MKKKETTKKDKKILQLNRKIVDYCCCGPTIIIKTITNSSKKTTKTTITKPTTESTTEITSKYKHLNIAVELKITKSTPKTSSKISSERKFDPEKIREAIKQKQKYLAENRNKNIAKITVTPDFAELRLLYEWRMLMEEILENYKTLWLKSVQDKKASYRNKDNNNTKTAEAAATSEQPQPQPSEPTSPVGSHKYVTFNRMRLLEDSLSEIESYLWDQFDRSVENLYYLHLRLAEHCLTTRFPDVNLKDSSVLFLNKTFENWMRKMLTATRQQTNDERQKYSIEVYHILKAFDLACINMNMLTSFNKIYKFDQNVNTLRTKLDELARRAAGGELVKIVSELKVNEQYPIDYESV